MCFLGDGAINEGEFHESMNLASLWDLPILFYLENNLYGMGSHVDRTHAGGRDLYLSAEGYKVPGAQVDGMDIVAVKEATTEALERIRSGSGPVFLEAMTYRFRGHSMADPTSYRQSSEVDVWRESDPIERFKKQAIENGLITEEEISSIDSEVETVIEEAMDYALQSPDPEMDSMFEHIYAEPGAEAA
jgi:pyruvate dehydrogenase E1 component alpha subunit